jgi:hypothetical protein
MELNIKTLIVIAAAICIIGVGGIYYYSVTNRPTHTVTVQIVGNGRVNLGTAGAYTTTIQVYDGQNLQLTALPDQGWVFNSWIGDLSGTANPISIVVTKDMRIVAAFTQS